MYVSSLLRRFIPSRHRTIIQPEPAGPVSHVIDCDTVPTTVHGDRWIREKWSVAEHQPGGRFEWDASKVALVQPQKARSAGQFRRELELTGRRVPNANVLDHLLAHQELIPDEWKRADDEYIALIYFFGTTYHTPYAREKEYASRLMYFATQTCSCAKAGNVSAEKTLPHLEGCDLGLPQKWQWFDDRLRDEPDSNFHHENRFAVVFTD